MERRPLPADETEERIFAMLAAADLPRPVLSVHVRTSGFLELTWANGVTYCFDLGEHEFDPFDEEDREAILGEGPGYGCPPVDVTVVGSPDDPRDEAPPPPGVRLHHVPDLHPDDVTVLHGIPTTTPSRTLIDLAEVLDQDELREAFRRADELGLLDSEAVRAARARVEWRPSLAVLDEVIEEHCR